MREVAIVSAGMTRFGELWQMRVEAIVTGSPERVVQVRTLTSL